MAQKIYIQLFIGSLLLFTFILALFAFFLEPSSPPPASDGDFPIIYLAIMVLGGLGILMAALVRLRR